MKNQRMTLKQLDQQLLMVKQLAKRLRVDPSRVVKIKTC